MLKNKVFYLLQLTLMLHSCSANARSHGSSVILDSHLTSHVDDSVRTNLDTLPYTEEEVNAKYPIPIEGDQSFPEFSADTPDQWLARVSRQAPVTPLDQDHLFFCNRQFLAFINRDGTGLRGFQTRTQNMIACDFDIRANYMFWSDVSVGHIARAKMDGSDLTILVQTNITIPDGIAWDWVSKKLYWTDAEDRDIEMFDPNTGDRSVLLQTGNALVSKPRAIVLDPVTSRKIYWTDWGTNPRIERASLDGSSRETLHSTGVFWPNALTIDIPTQILYWADAGYDRIECSRANGLGRRVLLSQYIFHPFGIDFFKGTLYWTDWQFKAVLNSTIHHATTQETWHIRSVISNLIHDPMGIKVVSLAKQPIDSVNIGTPSPTCNPQCQNNGTCSSPGVCNCTTGWRGSLCQEPICGQLCLNGGTCVAPDVCSCAAGWEGDRCGEAVCAGGCENGGSCASPGLCSCPSGWRGSSCSQPVCSRICEHGSCIGPDTCTCRSGWAGQFCDEAVCNPPCENGTCVRPDECVCHSGYIGRLCTEPICSRGCMNGGDCVAPDICECFPPYYGATCSDVRCFPPSGCLNGGHCVSPSLCACQYGWTGVRCSIPLCGSVRCVHGTCRGTNQCDCNKGWKGDSCDEAICFLPDGCQNGGRCIIPGYCSCATGWTGDRCDEGICTRGCMNGRCIGPDLCQCNSGWSGPTCSEAICTPKCVNGNCVRPNLCVCDHGYYGFRCEY